MFLSNRRTRTWFVLKSYRPVPPGCISKVEGVHNSKNHVHMGEGARLQTPNRFNVDDWQTYY
ncbi:hypothetical protein CY34DRAFT_805701 [Suillus luteus UH-Slu-Lm8-n1]|uniref:Uncharacterized protein n=1 Tax=Suillus luteus UH-Slu-Lm8-n1 TaxID=930992 RepID=A0A0D0BEK9_9AGAM|nr:hypothetical protein CY34DRAFT_805701 [Suillus luteus UH-Slu-Lm8-n1]